MPQLKFNPYFTIGFTSPTKAEALPFVLGERLFLNLILWYTTTITSDIAVEYYGEPYEEINPRFAAWFYPDAEIEVIEEIDVPICRVERANDSSGHLVELAGDGTDLVIEAVLTADEPEVEFPVALYQTIRVPFEIYKVLPNPSEKDLLFVIGPAGDKHGPLVVAEVELIEER